MGRGFHYDSLNITKPQARGGFHLRLWLSFRFACMRREPLLGNAVALRDRIAKNTDLGWEKGENHEERGNDTKCCHGKCRMVANGVLTVHLPCFIQKSRRGAHEKDGDIEPIGRFADGAVVGIIKDGNQHDAEHNSPHFNTPKIRSFAKKEAL